ncbi:MAG TPA: glycosyltransferase [Chitinophagales bacterium]|nr:glycosyltransferase [Chitinophagales bacterium]HMY42506.1 glycosyltransferase [Chitinophagales bacterium]HNG27232.1 glycosyltransferase [Chitinophagales bacterium]
MIKQRKKILFLTPQLPYPVHSGGFIKSYRMLVHLAAQHDVDFASLLKGEDVQLLEEFKASIPNIMQFFTVPSNIERNAINILKANLQFKPISFYRNFSKQLDKLLQTIFANYDIIIVDHVDMFQYIPKQYFHKTILHQHNAEYVMWKRAAEVESNFIKKIVLFVQFYLLGKLEHTYCNQAKYILASPNDEVELKRIGVRNKNFFETYHLGDDSLLHQTPLVFDKENKNLLYIGTLTWEANIDGLIWFLDNVWQTLSTENKGISLTIMGKNPDKRLLKFKQQFDNIIFPGFIENVEPYFQNAKLFIVPLRFGSGIKVKVISAMYRGIPCVTSDIGAEGLMVENCKQIMLANDVKSYINAIQTLLNDEDKWNTISKESRILAQEKYSWEAVFKVIDEVITKFP